MTSRFIILHTAAIAVIAGAIEVARLAWGKLLAGKIVMSSWQEIWLTPASSVLLFLPFGLALATTAYLAPHLMPMSSALAMALGLGAFAVLFLAHPSLHLVAIVLLAAGVAGQAARLLRRDYRRFATILGRTGLALATLSALGGIVLHTNRTLVERRARLTPPPARSTPNVLLIVLDTVRAESLSLYGYSRETSPALQRFAARGTTFTRAYSTTSWTLPSHASLFTGRYPHELVVDWRVPLDGAEPTLAEVLGGRGYATGGFVANVAYTSRETGLARGFSHYEDYTVVPGEFVVASSLGRFVTYNPRFRQMIGFYDVFGRKSTADVGTALTRWLDGLDGRPYFAFLNLYDAHEPYLPPPPFDAAFDPVEPRELSEIRQLGGRMAERRRKREMSEAQRLEEQRAYDQSIASLDQQLGTLLTGLEQRGHLRNTIVVITADHGEAFGEHKFFTHGIALYLTTLHVPLVIVHPETVPAGSRDDRPVSLRDLPATIAGLAFGQASLFPGGSYFAHDGEPLSPILATLEPAPNGDYPPDVPHPPMRSVIVDDHHYIRNGDGSEELYDLREDAEENVNRSGDAAKRALLERSRAMLASAGALRD